MNKTELIIRSILELYSERLETHGYTDSDWRDEKPTAIDKFFRDCKKDIEMILNPMQEVKQDEIAGIINHYSQMVINRFDANKLDSATIRLRFEQAIQEILQSSSSKNTSNWYKPEELYQYLLKNNYNQEIASELAKDYADNLQKAFEKGKQFRETNNEKMFTLDEIMTIQRTYPYYLTTKELEIILKKYLEERDNKQQLKVPAQTNTEISERLKQLSAKHPTLIKYYSKDITQKEYLTALGHEKLIVIPDGKVFISDAIWIKCYNNDDGNTIAVPEITMNFFYLIDEYIKMLQSNTFHPLEMADTPLPLYDMIGKLIDATHILLHEKDYDRHGWEEIQASYKKAIEWRGMYEAYRKSKH